MEDEEINQEENAYEEASLRAEASSDATDDYGAPSPEDKINQFKITQEALKSKINTKTTYLTTMELGRPLFSMRFYLDCAEMCKMYNSKLLEKYFRNKAQTMASSGMSREGFIMKLNVTNRKDVIRRHPREKEIEENDSP